MIYFKQIDIISFEMCFVSFLDGGASSERQLFLTYAALEENAEKLEQHHTGLARTLEDTNSADLDNVKQL